MTITIPTNWKMYAVAIAIFLVGGAQALNWITPAMATALFGLLGGISVAGLFSG